MSIGGSKLAVTIGPRLGASQGRETKMTNHPKRNLSSLQRETLAKIAESGCSGICIRYTWAFQIDGDFVTRQVNQLRKKGMVDMLAFRGGRAAINVTDKGRAALAA